MSQLLYGSHYLLYHLNFLFFLVTEKYNKKQNDDDDDGIIFLTQIVYAHEFHHALRPLFLPSIFR